MRRPLMPALSVLMPVRNAGRWLAPSLASLRRQTLGDIEILAVDDGSTDGSGGLLDRVAVLEPRLRVIHTPPRGVPLALETARAAARSPLLARHDADDLSHPLRLEVQRGHLLRHPEAAVVGCRVRLLPRGFSGMGMRRWVAWHNALLGHHDMAREVLIDSPLAHATAVFRHETLAECGGWRERGWPEDLDLWVRLLERGARFAKVGRTLYAWRQHAANATRHDPRNRRERFDALRLDALGRGLLRDAHSAAVVGVGASLERWRAHLGRLGLTTRVHAIGRPLPGVVEALLPPVVLVFGAPAVRARWRLALEAARRREGRDFAFVA